MCKIDDSKSNGFSPITYNKAERIQVYAFSVSLH